MPSESMVNARAVTPTDRGDLSIDGVPVGPVVAPEDPDALTEALDDARAAGRAVFPVGGGTSLGLGNIPRREGIALSTLRLDRVLDYEPADLVISVEAGITLAALQRVLAENGQWLPVETPWPERSTLGGMIATARAGPRRHGSGTLRDLLIGMAVAHPGGTVTRSGGMVVKNVSGFDMPRLYHGSLGTLGVVVSANLKVLPLPRAGATVIIEAGDLASAGALIDRLRTVGPDAVAFEASLEDDHWRVAIRFEGRGGGVDRLVSQLVATVSAPSRVLMNGDGKAWWQGAIDASSDGPSDALETVSGVRPREAMALVSRVLDRCLAESIVPEAIRVSPGVGTVAMRCRINDGGEDAAVRLIGALRSGSDHTVVRSAPVWVKRRVDVWGPEPETIDVQRSLKRHFDPDGVLNPGRFIGRI